ncbi:MAG: exo-alpha-sialidase [Draconibacterium sp.]
MILKRWLALTFFLYSSLNLLACSSSGDTGGPQEVPGIKELTDGVRIAWDYSTRVKIAPAAGHTEAYCGYSRLIQLYNGNLACVYETSSGNIELVFSNDLGETRGAPQIVFSRNNNINMAVPDIIQLSDHSILVACNPRPRKPYTNDRKFGIKVRKSTDGGISWQDEQLVYEAQSTFNDGCWEPSFIQLPNGEVQLFFANEGIFTQSNEQNISMLRSGDFGETWSPEPVIVGFREGHRDGMPVPLLLKDKGEILLAVEDNKIGEFKPAVYHEKLDDNWADGYVAANDQRRDYHPLTAPLPNETYAGAPYLARLKTGEVLLSYQSNWNRTGPWDRSCQMVEIGTDSGTQFRNRTVPFKMTSEKRGLWNSIAVIKDGTVPVALTSTNAYSSTSTEVWMIKGHVIPEYEIKTGSPIIDGALTDECWQTEWPYFVGHESPTKMKASLCIDDNNLYVAATVGNPTSEFASNGKITFQLDTQRKGYEAPHEGNYSFECGFDGQIVVKEGSYGEWVDKNASGEVQCRVKNNSSASQLELAIPLQLIGNKMSSTLGVNFVLSYQAQGNTINESLANCDDNSPYSWCPVITE